MKIRMVLAAVAANFALGAALGLVVRAHDAGMPDDSKWVTGCNVLPGWDKCAYGEWLHLHLGAEGHSLSVDVPTGAQVHWGRRCAGINAADLYYVRGC